MKSVNSLRESFKLQRTGLPNPQTWQWYIIVEELRVPQQQRQLNGKKFIGHCSAETSGLGEGGGVGDRKLPEREKERDRMGGITAFWEFVRHLRQCQLHKR